MLAEHVRGADRTAEDTAPTCRSGLLSCLRLACTGPSAGGLASSPNLPVLLAEVRTLSQRQRPLPRVSAGTLSPTRSPGPRCYETHALAVAYRLIATNGMPPPPPPPVLRPPVP